MTPKGGSGRYHGMAGNPRGESTDHRGGAYGTPSKRNRGRIRQSGRRHGRAHAVDPNDTPVHQLGVASPDWNIRPAWYEAVLLRKEVIQPHLPVRLPCYDFTPIADSTFDNFLPKRVGTLASGVSDSHGVTGGVYKARERIQRSVLTCVY